ncbi:MAG: cyclophilin-like family protein [Pseudomonadota bacterium]
MPTNLLRTTPDKRERAKPPSTAKRVAVLKVGKAQVRIDLVPSRTADVIWRALPIYAIAETWGESIHFEVPVRAGRERGARLNAGPRDILFWADDDRVVFVWGPTPISRDHERRLMRPCNVWAEALDPLTVFAGTVPGAKVSLVAETR